MIYKVRADELDAQPFYVEADSQVEALALVLKELERLHAKPYDASRPFEIECVADKILK